MIVVVKTFSAGYRISFEKLLQYRSKGFLGYIVRLALQSMALCIGKGLRDCLCRVA
jgi:hypothetical protein